MNTKNLAVLLVAFLITACGSGDRGHQGQDNAVSSAPQEVMTGVPAENNEAALATEAAPAEATTPLAEQKPETILNEEVSKAEQERKMVRTANIDFTATDVVKAALDIEKLVVQDNGILEQKDIGFDVSEVRKQNIADGKIKVFEKITPTAMMTVRIPSEKTANFVNKLLPLMYFLNQQQYSAKRYELKTLEEKVNLSNTISSDTPRRQVSEIEKLTQMEIKDRVQYSTITIAINQPMLVRERLEVDLDEVARLNGDGFWTRAWHGVQSGWYFILNVVVGLITIWPLYLFLILSLLAFRLLKPLYNKWMDATQNNTDKEKSD